MDKDNTRIKFLATPIKTAQRSYVTNNWRKPLGNSKKLESGITAFFPVDPYKTKERKEFRSAMDNPYVYRACRIETSFVAGLGYTIDIVPRKNENIKDEELDSWKEATSLKIPYFENKELSPKQLKDWFFKYTKEIDLNANGFNGYFTALEQGRCALALTPIIKDDNDKWTLPTGIRLIRPEFTMRPIINEETYELVGVQAVGVDTPDSMIPAERMIYIMLGFNNELFSDYYGDSQVARVSDIANTLNVVLNDDYGKTAMTTHYAPRVFSVPINPQDYGQEDSVISTFAKKLNEGEGLDVAVTGPSNKDDPGVTLLAGSGDRANISGLEIIRQGLIKALITSFGMPAFMLSEGDIGQLGGNANIEEIDSYISTEINSKKITLEQTLESQFYDRILCILFDIDDPDQLPVKIEHRFNRPRLFTLVTPDYYMMLKQLVADGLMTTKQFSEFLGLEFVEEDTITKGADTSPNYNTMWKDQALIGNQNNWKPKAGPWGAMPKGYNARDLWFKSKPTERTALEAWTIVGKNNGWI